MSKTNKKNQQKKQQKQKLTVFQKRARARIMKDIKELARSDIPSIAALPMENNIMEFHVNIKPTTGVYSGVYFHLIMKFPDTYPDKPPTIEIMTPIEHPNIFNSYLCLSMIRPHTTNDAYEGWSSAYTITSILMQLQSFLFAEKIDQDGGYSVNARLNDFDVKNSIALCKKYKCKCGHSHTTPKPNVKGPKESLIKVLPLDEQVQVLQSACQTTYTYWVGAYGDFGCNFGKVMYEVLVNWTGDKWAKNNIRGGLCRFGWGTSDAKICGKDIESFGYGGTGWYSHADKFEKFGETFTKNDIITCAIDFDNGIIYFAKNGKLLESNKTRYIPDYIWNKGTPLYPLLSFKNSRAEFNFGNVNKPVKYLIDNGFKTLEQIAIASMKQGEDDIEMKDEKEVDWIDNEYMIDNLWIKVFEYLDFYGNYRCEIVCKKFNKIINQYNLKERYQIKCFYSKNGLYDKKVTLGIGLNIENTGFRKLNVVSQYDILSVKCYKLDVNTGVWGEKLTHFLPLIINKQHIGYSHKELLYRLDLIHKTYMKSPQPQWYKETKIDHEIRKDNYLKYTDMIIEMMNNIVVHLVMNEKGNNKKGVKMQLCEKALMGYCSFHHILLYLIKQSNNIIVNFADKIVAKFLSKDGHTKRGTPDLGKLLIYLMISNYKWSDIAVPFTLEVFTRNVKWYTQSCQYLNTAGFVKSRLNDTWNLTSISRNLVQFQIWFMRNFSDISYKEYNDRLGQPSEKLRNKLQQTTKKILCMGIWRNYFNSINIIISKNKINIDKEVHYLLQWSILNSCHLGYHKMYGYDPKQKMKLPKMIFFDPSQPGSKNNFNDINDDDMEGSNNNVNINGFGGSRGRGNVIKRASFRGKTTLMKTSNGRGNVWNKNRGNNNNNRVRGRGRGRGQRPRGRGWN